jgi:hypothetical protein
LRNRSYVFGDGHRQPLDRRIKRMCYSHMARQVGRRLRRVFKSTLSFHNSASGRCDPSQTTIGRLAGYRRETVNRTHAELRDNGWLDWTPRLGWEEQPIEHPDLFGGTSGTERVARQRTSQYFLGPKLEAFLASITLTKTDIYSPYVDGPAKPVDKSDGGLPEALRRAFAGLAATAGWAFEASG